MIIINFTDIIYLTVIIAHESYSNQCAIFYIIGVIPMADEEKKKKFRIHLLDEIRGLAVFCMIFYHAFYTMGSIFNMEWGKYLFDLFEPVEPLFAGVFIFVSGIACNLSKSNIERGVKLGVVALGVTLVTYFFDKNQVIIFGILHMLALCMIIYGLIGRFLRLFPMWLMVPLGFILFFLSQNICKGYLEIPFLVQWKLPSEWYTTDFLFMFGLPKPEFFSADYFPLIPWIFIFSFGRLIPKKKLPKWIAKKHIPPLAFLGRHALLFYIAHQPIIFGICWLIQKCMSMFQPAAEQK